MQILNKMAVSRLLPSPSPSPCFLRTRITGTSSSPKLLPCLPQQASTLSSLRLLSPQLDCFNNGLAFSLHAGNVRPFRTVSVSAAAYGGFEDPEEIAKREKVSKRLESAARHFKRLGTLGFWGQMVCTVVSAVILAFSVAISGTPTSQATFYATAGGIAAAFLSVFWSFGYIRLSERLRNTINDLKKAPPRAEVVKNLQNGIIINLLGMGLTLLGLQATVGTLVAKALTSSAGPYLQGTPAGYSPVLALDVFLVQASSNTVLSHFLGLVFSLELLRSVTLSQPPPETVIPKPA